MRITINYFEGYPELEADLTTLPPRSRAERLRLLATMGLAFMQNGHHVPAATETAAMPGRTSATTAQPAVGKGAGAVASSLIKNVFRQAEE